MELIELRQAMRAIYAERSLSISDCYKLEKIHKVECIYYNLEDKTSKQLAEILQKQIEAYSFQPVLIQGITFNLIANNYYLGWKEALRLISIEKKDIVWLNIDHLQMGVGGDNTWGAQVHPEYTITPRQWEYSFTLQPLNAETDAAELSHKTWF